MRIIVADHHENSRWALKLALEEHPEFNIVGEAVDSEGLLDQSSNLQPDLILMERGLPGSPIEDLIADLHAIVPKPIVMVMSTDPEYGKIVLIAGADAFVSKGDEPYWLMEKLHKYAKVVKMNEKEDTRIYKKNNEQSVVSAADQGKGCPNGVPPKAIEN